MGLFDKLRSWNRTTFGGPGLGRGSAARNRSRDPSATESPEDALARLAESMEVLKRLSALKEEIIASEPAGLEETSIERGLREEAPPTEPVRPKPVPVAAPTGWAPVAARGRRLTEPAPRTTGGRTSLRERVSRPTDLRAQVGQVFSPSAPVSRRDLFAGRTQQMEDLVDTIYERGQHAVIYGERGVGKTSLAAVMSQVLDDSALTVVRVNCDGADDFTSIWQKILTEIARDGSDLAAADALVEVAGKKSVTPNDVRYVLQAISPHGECVIFIDEFDTLQDDTIHGLFADTIKTLSDQLVPSTLVIIGVADDLDEMISEHASVRRALAQIQMPRMSQAELGEIVGRGLRHLDLACEGSALTRITTLSRGFPYYTKLLAQTAAREAITRGGHGIALTDVEESIGQVVERVHETIRGLYNQATHGAEAEAYRRVLRASALASWDERGYFSTGDVAKVWSIVAADGSSGDVTKLLNELSKVTRGRAMEKKKTARGTRYRFSVTLLQPYVLMEGLVSGAITPELLDEASRST